MMRLAFFSPLPPSKSGIADYSQALIEQLRRHAEVETFEAAPEGFDPGRYDACIYQMGNNRHHEGAWRAALAHPGVVVLHEANLHHLIAEITIKRGDWDAYLEELAYDGGLEALERGKRVQAGEIGPDYYGVPMLRRTLERARAVIVHSRYVESKVREAGFSGPVAVIPHGAWLPEADRNEYRRRLGLDETTPLAGIFGFLKPYKRIPECLRAFRRLVRLELRAKMILTGEPHPELDIPALVASLDLEDSVRLLGFVSEEDLNGFIAACDVVLNLRHPTVGESSGTLLRALGLGRAAIVSEVGAFAELPDEVCLKVPPGPAEEDLMFEYLNLLVSRPEIRRTLGRQARRWVETHCSWPIAARRYLEFARAVAEGREWKPAEPEPAPAPEPERPAEEPAEEGVPAEEPPKKAVLDWCPPEGGAREYVETHMDRLAKTLAITPRGGPGDRILEMGAYMQITPALHFELGYGEVRGCYYGEAGKQDLKEVTA
ncbi:MAG TPA: glycosyltransferase, partial [Bryobacterales bacterium]|nr:glycosyltransferase [Bryobacterales bacterium]